MPHFTAKLLEQTLGSLSSTVQGNPNLLSSYLQYPCVTLTSPSKSGGKFWQGIACEHELYIRWGKTSTQGTVKHIPTSQCIYQNPVEELKVRCLKKLGSGYDIDPHNTILP